MTVDSDSPGFTVTGLAQAGKNLLNIGSGELRTQIARDASRAAGWKIANAIKGKTYTTFNFLDGLIGTGMTVRVSDGIKGTVLNAVVVEKEQAGALLRKRSRLQRDPSLSGVAVWWRWLEFGTQERRAKKTPKFVYHPSTKRPLTKKATAYRALTLGRWAASASRGGISERSWVRPTFSATARAAVEEYERTMRARTESEVSNLPK